MKKKIIAFVLTVLMLSALVTATAYAEAQNIPGTSLTWEFDAGTLKICGSGTMVNFSSADTTPWSAHNNDITAVAIDDTVTSIASYAFAGTKITTVTLPKYATSLGANAFPATLTSITIPCQLEKNENLPAGITPTVNHAVYKVEKQEPTPTTPGYKEHYQCSGCAKLFTDATCASEITDKKTIELLGWSFNSGSGTLSITGTGAIADFSTPDDTPWAAYNSGITSVFIDGAVTAIGSNAFSATHITSIDIPRSVNSLGANAFPASLKSIRTTCKLEDNPNLPAGITPVVEHNVSYKEEKPATVSTDGLMAHWECSDCGKMFRDAYCKDEVSESDLIIPRTDKTAPVLTAVQFSRTAVSESTSVDVQVYATETGSGLSEGTLTMVNTTKISESLPVTCKLSVNALGLYGTLQFPAAATSGDYYISSLTLTDKAGNTSEYSKADSVCSNLKITVKRSTQLSTTGTLALSATSMGYGGSVTGTVYLKDTSGNYLPYKTLDVYVNGTKTSLSAKTDENGKAEFKYSSSTAGSYILKAVYIGDEDYKGCETNTVTLTVTNVPATGDIYDAPLWIAVAVLAIGVNAWFIINRKRA